MLAVAVEFPRGRAFRNISGTISAIYIQPRAFPIPASSGRLGSMNGFFSALRAQGITTTQRYGLFGHSAGGQYVHRMLSFGYRDHVAVAISANAGTYAMPDLATDWPWGLGATGVTRDDLRVPAEFSAYDHGWHRGYQNHRAIFSQRTEVAETRSDPVCPSAHLFANWTSAAADLGVSLAWRVIDVPDVGHDGRQMSDAAAPLIAEPRRD